MPDDQKYIDAVTSIQLGNAKNAHSVKPLGCSVPTSEEPSEFFLGEYVEACKKVSKNSSNNTQPQNPFIDNAAFYPSKESGMQPKPMNTSCEILTLNNPQDLERFNLLLNARSNPQSKIEVKVMDKQYNQELKTWQIFVIYDTMSPLNLIK